MTIKIAVTGGIASGKSTVCKLFSEKLKCKYYNCDIIVSKLYNDYVFCLKNFSRHKFFSSILDENGLVDKTKLRELIVENPHRLIDISQIVWVELEKLILQIMNSEKEKFIIFEVPLLFESGFDKLFDFIVNIESNFKNRVDRSLNSHIDQKFFDIFVSQQVSNEFRKCHADFTIFNNGDVQSLDVKINNLINILNDKFLHNFSSYLVNDISNLTQNDNNSNAE
jgi:dephospho-CoA kinase